MPAPTRDPQDALSALERLYQRKVVTLEEAQAAARFITGDEGAVFPPPASPPPPEVPPAPDTSGKAAAPPAEPAADSSSDAPSPG